MVIKIDETQLDAGHCNQFIVVDDCTDDGVPHSKIVGVFDRGYQGFSDAIEFCKESNFHWSRYTVTTFGEEIERAARLKVDMMILEEIWN